MVPSAEVDTQLIDQMVAIGDCASGAANAGVDSPTDDTAAMAIAVAQTRIFFMEVGFPCLTNKGGNPPRVDPTACEPCFGGAP